MDTAAISRLLAEIERRESREGFGAEKLAFGPQLAAIRSNARRRVLRCGRRAGKTTAVAIKLLEGALKPPYVPQLYVTLTRANAKEIIWEDLLRLNHDHSLGGVPNLTDLTLRWETGGAIQLRGANNERETAKFRGKKFKLAVIDEAQSFPDRIISPLVREVIGPALRDHRGDFWVVGTPAPVNAGFFYDIDQGRLASKWEHHHWTLRENEMFPALLEGATIDDIIAEVLAENGWTISDPSFLREYCGQWVIDLSSLLFDWSDARNGFTGEPPQGRWNYVFGVDLGHDDSDAIAVLGWRDGEDKLHLVEEFTQDKQDVDDLAEELIPRIEKYKPIRVCVDQGGLGKKIVKTLQNRYGLALEAADKARKGEYIKLLNTDLRKGRILARPDGKFAQDCRLVQKCAKAWARGELKEKATQEGGYHSDICDAVLYGWRACLHYLEQAPPPPPTNEQRLDAWEAREAERIEQQKQLAWHERDGVGAGFDEEYVDDDAW